MSKKILSIVINNPLDIFGVNDVNLKTIQKIFSDLKIIGRGNELKAIGNEKKLIQFEEKINCLLTYHNKHKTLTVSDIEKLLLKPTNCEKINLDFDETILVHGNNGKFIKTRTPNQHVMVNECAKNDLIFAVGPAGSGKTYTAIALAVKALRNKEVKRIILSRPAVEAGEHLGFLPGQVKEKLDPYLQPLYDALCDMIPQSKLKEYYDEGIIQIAPLAYMRGRTLNNAFVILDEAQNATINQLKMFLTRMGENVKFIITGDITQIDLPNKNQSGMLQALKILKNIKEISIIYFNENDIVRHKLVKKIVDAYENS